MSAEGKRRTVKGQLQGFCRVWVMQTGSTLPNCRKGPGSSSLVAVVANCYTAA